MKPSEAMRHAVDTMLLAEIPRQVSKNNDEAITIEYALLRTDVPTFYKYCKEGWQCDEWEIETPATTETQQLRFMFAEFIALMWEDEENDAQTEVS